MNRLLLRTKVRLRDAAKPARRSRRRRADDRAAAHHALFRSGQDRELLRPRHRASSAAGCARTGSAARISRPPSRKNRRKRSRSILAGVWDNLGRIGAEFAHLDHIWDYDVDHPDKPSRVEFAREPSRFSTQLTNDGKPAIIFASHLGNWEMPALGAVAHGLDCAILFRRPNSESADRAIERIRAVKMGTLIPAGREAPLKLAEALQNGQHVAMLVDQYLTNGVEVTFFGRKTKANPTLARLLRQVECPIHGVRIIRLPNHRFRAELSEEVKPVRDAAGKVDIQGTMQAVTSVVEGWVREYPDQWLWLHRRWR